MNTVSQKRPLALFAAMLLVYGGCVLWLGSIVFFGAGVASVVFKQLPSKDLAGTLNGVILHRLNIIEHVAAVMLLAGLLMTAFRAQSEPTQTVQSAQSLRNARTLAPVAFVVLMCALLAYYAHVITPQMEALKSQISSFDAPTQADMPLVAEFRSWHVVYSRLVSVNLVLGALVFGWQTWLYSSLVDTSFSSQSDFS